MSDLEPGTYRAVNLQDLFDLVVTADDYGHGNSMLMSSLAEWISHVDNRDIDQFLETIANDDRYDQEDVEYALEKLTEFFQQYEVDVT